MEINNYKYSEKYVQNQILFWSLQNGWSLDVFDSKAILHGGKKEKNPGIPVGTPDLVGCSDIGLSAFVELKRQGYRDACRMSQHLFLSRKIESNAFCIVTDSVEHLSETYQFWLSLREKSFKEAREFLLKELPKKVLINGIITSLKNQN